MHINGCACGYEYSVQTGTLTYAPEDKGKLCHTFKRHLNGIRNLLSNMT